MSDQVTRTKVDWNYKCHKPLVTRVLPAVEQSPCSIFWNDEEDDGTVADVQFNDFFIPHSSCVCS